LKPVISPGAFSTLIFRFSASSPANRRGAVKDQFGSRNTPRSRAEIWQGNHGTTAMTVRCETLLRYKLRTFGDVDANVFGREILLQSELTLVGRVRCHNTDKFLLIDHFGQQRRWHMAFIPDQGKIEPTVTQVLENISSPTCEREANLSRHRENFATENGSDDRGALSVAAIRKEQSSVTGSKVEPEMSRSNFGNMISSS
jgi:hypothetical protein